MAAQVTFHGQAGRSIGRNHLATAHMRAKVTGLVVGALILGWGITFLLQEKRISAAAQEQLAADARLHTAAADLEKLLALARSQENEINELQKQVAEVPRLRNELNQLKQKRAETPPGKTAAATNAAPRIVIS